MSDEFKFWNHGVDVHVQDESASGLSILRTDGGSLVRQAAGSSNTFLFAIPTPSRLDDDGVEIRHVHLRLFLERGVVISGFRVIENRDHTINIHYSHTEEIRDAVVDEKFDIPSSPTCDGPVVVAIDVAFIGTSGMDLAGPVTFRGVGVRFEEKT